MANLDEGKELSPEARRALAGALPSQKAQRESAVKFRENHADKTIEAVAESADFGPAYKGEEYVTLTFRVPKAQAAIPGIWHLTPIGPGTRDWATDKFPPDDE